MDEDWLVVDNLVTCSFATLGIGCSSLSSRFFMISRGQVCFTRVVSTNLRRVTEGSTIVVVDDFGAGTVMVCSVTKGISAREDEDRLIV